MSEMHRLSEDPSVPTSLRAALREAGAEKASPRVVRQVLGGVAVGAATVGLASGAASKASPVAAALFGGSVTAKVVVAAALFTVGGVIGGYTVHVHDRQVGALGAVSAPVAARTSSAAPVATSAATLAASPPAPVPAPEPPVAAAPVLPAVPAPVENARASRAAPPAQTRVARPVEPKPDAPPTTDVPPLPPPASASPAPAKASLREQFTSLRGIRDAVEGDRPAAALAAIAAHRATFPGTPFDQELLLLEARARWAQGDRSVCEVTSRFAAAYPRSLLAPRVLALAAEAACPGKDSR